MAAPKFQKNKVTQKIDLKEIFGVDFGNKKSLKAALGQAIIDRMISRTASGKGISFGKNGGGKPVKLHAPYSDSYIKSAAFKAAGKSKNKINMKLKGDMLGTMDIIKETSNSITVGWEEKKQNNKAFNHSVGDTLPRRPFFGVNKKELNKIKTEFKDDIKTAIKIKKDQGPKKFESFVSGLLDKLDGDKS